MHCPETLNLKSDTSEEEKEEKATAKSFGISNYTYNESVILVLPFKYDSRVITLNFRSNPHINCTSLYHITRVSKSSSSPESTTTMHRLCQVAIAVPTWKVLIVRPALVFAGVPTCFGTHHQKLASVPQSYLPLLFSLVSSQQCDQRSL